MGVGIGRAYGLFGNCFFVSCCISHRVRRSALGWDGEVPKGANSIDSGVFLLIEFRLLYTNTHARTFAEPTVMGTAVSGT